MRNFISFENLTTRKKPFHVLNLKKESVCILNHEKNNYIFFVISGRMLLKNKKGKAISMQPEHMYALCKFCAPYQAEITEDSQIIVLLADSLANHIDIVPLLEITPADSEVCNDISELPYNDVFKSYLQHIIILDVCCDIGSDVYELKKAEYLHYMRKLYSKEELAQFIYNIVLTYSKFKMSVYQNYHNAINVESLAESMFMTTKTFTRHFKQEFNTTPYKWILEQKTHNLNHYIINRGLLIPEILEEFDFPSVSALKQFCKRNDMEQLLEML